VISSASSKTATGLAFLLAANRAQRDQDYRIVGLTSPSNKDFVSGLGYYDDVLDYQEVMERDCLIDDGQPLAGKAVLVDFAGNSALTRRVHHLLDEALTYSCIVGSSHWNKQGIPNGQGDLPGPAPELFFAPAQGAKRNKEWGHEKLHGNFASAWQLFLQEVDDWLEVQTVQGEDATQTLYQDFLTGNFSPKKGHIVSLLPA